MISVPAGHHRPLLSSIGLAGLSIAAAMLLLPRMAEAGQCHSPPPRAVVELFTSQGCASCPPADAMLHHLAEDRSVVALTLPVTCWDYLGWQDTLASEQLTLRQRAYAGMRGGKHIYTPQVVINGAMSAVGSDKSAVNDAMKQARTAVHEFLLTPDVALEKETFRISVRSHSPALSVAKAGVYLAPFYRQRSVAVEGGENRDKQLDYSNVVSGFIKVGDWNGHEMTVTVDSKQALPGSTDGFAVLIQDGNEKAPGQIIGAALVIPEEDCE